ncbi:related to SYF2 - pre-mRNA-splicing factor [Melanopsichium pennsylvanicum]|uniref:Pre-mRNA-splicing factor SYF2 n=2 Tax=Melanopsichium pennsylvanicum TaxID=63383 RepID=A0AAJ4XFJ7_9BASI|nr:related to SYF2-pre-mRNA-splicing factor [Melanopsichium pennsylvanicum 4]SNX81545.1 related to SYF2 - pre-mRNA-splicing factor [Melanopsichium pennsylvanicum]
MPPRRTRAAKKAEDATEDVHTAPSGSTPPKDDAEVSSSSSAPITTAKKPKGKIRAPHHQSLLPEIEASAAQETPESSAVAESPSPEGDPSDAAPKPSMEDRKARLAALRAKMAASTKANRRDILSEQARTRAVGSELRNPGASRKLQKAEKILEERDLRESGEDVERHRNMQYSLEDSERWDAKLEENERRKDQGPGDFGDAAERAYQRQVRMMKPDVAGYRKKRDEAEAVKAANPATLALTIRGIGKGKTSQPHDAETDEIHYGTHNPSDDAIDRVVNHLNHEQQVIKNRSRRRNDDADAEVNYINDSNRHFNKKLKRFYDKQTQEIRENLERGTAL